VLYIIIFIILNQPQIGFNAWGPIIDQEFLVPKSDWYDGWQHLEWHFINESVENAIKSGHFNKDLKYMSGVTTQEAAYILCKYINHIIKI